MAAKRKRKVSKEKKEFKHWVELTGLFLVIISLLSIVPTPMGIIGQLGASFSMFLIGTFYQVLLFFLLIFGLYLLFLV